MIAENSAYSLRRTIDNARWFLAGKVLSALATLTWMAWVARTLIDQGDYVAYVASIAYLETALALSTVGLDWLLIRFLPVCVSAGNGIGLRRLLLKTLLARFAGAAIVATVVGLLAQQIEISGPLKNVPVLLWCGLLICEACLRLLRDCVLETLAAQFLTQLGILGRTLLALAGFGLLQAFGHSMDVSTVLAIELGASFFMLLCVMGWTWKVASRVPSTVADEAPAWYAAWKASWHNYQSALISLPLSPQALVLLVSHFAEPRQIQVFGFVVRLYETVRNYIPGLLLMSVLRPRLLGTYALHQDFNRVAREAGLISNLSALSVTLIVALLVAYGDWLLVRLAGEDFRTGQAALVALLATMLLRVHRQLGQVLVNCVGEVALLTRLALVGLLGWPVAVLAAQQGYAVLGVLVAAIWDDLAWVLLLSRSMAARGLLWPHHFGFMLCQLALALATGLAAGFLLPGNGAVQVALGSALLCALLLGLMILFRWLSPKALLQQLKGGGA